MSDCTSETLLFPACHERQVEASFNGGVLMLRQADRLLGLTGSLACGLADARQRGMVASAWWTCCASGCLALRSATRTSTTTIACAMTSPETRIVVRADSGLCRWRPLSWCERNDIGWIIGLAKNAGLVALACDVGNRFALEPGQNLLPAVPGVDRHRARFPHVPSLLL